MLQELIQIRESSVYKNWGTFLWFHLQHCILAGERGPEIDQKIDPIHPPTSSKTFIFKI